MRGATAILSRELLAVRAQGIGTQTGTLSVLLDTKQRGAPLNTVLP
jgi:hypothetical protein